MYEISKLTKSDCLRSFVCGIEDVDNTIRNLLPTCINNNEVDAYVVTSEGEIVAIFALRDSFIELDQTDIHEELQDFSEIVDDGRRERYPALDLSLLAVSKNHQRRGIGRLIIDTLIENHSRFGSADNVFLFVDAFYVVGGSYSSIEFYQKCNFSNTWQNVKIDTYRMFKGIRPYTEHLSENIAE